MPNGHIKKEYGAHKYGDDLTTSDCAYGCGCWMGPCRSGGPPGLDPFGKCPKNPADGKLLGGNADYNYVVEERIADLITRLNYAENQLKRVSPSKAKLARELTDTRAELSVKNQLLEEIRRIVGTSK